MNTWLKSYCMICYFHCSAGNLGNKKNFFKKHFKKKYKFEIDFPDFHIYGKLWITPFRLLRWNLWGVLVCRQWQILYSKTSSKINFEVLYLTPISLYLEKNKIWGCRLIITTLQPLGLAFFNSITKFLTIHNILNHSLLCFTCYSRTTLKQ